MDKATIYFEDVVQLGMPEPKVLDASVSTAALCADWGARIMTCTAHLELQTKAWLYINKQTLIVQRQYVYISPKKRSAHSAFHTNIKGGTPAGL